MGVDATWLGKVSAWLLAHRSYPEVARRRGQQGTVVVHAEVDSEGHVLQVSMVNGSGSALLDEAAMSLVRFASLPPFPADMPVPTQAITVPIRYELD
jgi:protein TonB